MKFIKKNLKVITVLFVMIILIGGVFLKVQLKQNEVVEETKEDIIFKEEVTEDATEDEITPIEKVYVDIKGAVVAPGVYEVEANKKVIDVIQLAGGLTDQADTTLINLAKQVKNEMVVIIYTGEEVKEATTEKSIAKIIDKECVCPKVTNDACLNTESEDTSSKNTDTTSQSTTNTKVNLNTATVSELQTLSGIGESKAEAIIAYREEHGSFKTIEEIKEVSGIGDALYEKIKDNITV